MTVDVGAVQSEILILQEEVKANKRKYWDLYGKPPLGVSPTPPQALEDYTHPFALKVPWEHYSKMRLIGCSLFYACFTEAASLHYCQHAHQNQIPYTGTIAGVMKSTLQTEGLNAFRAYFPPLAVQSALAKFFFFPVFEFLRLKTAVPYMTYGSNEEESIRTGLCGVAASGAVFWFSRVGELNNILASKFHTFPQKMNPLPFGPFSVIPRYNTPYRNSFTSSLAFTTRFLIPNMLWWPTYTYTKNLRISEGFDPLWGGQVMIGVSALAASAVTTLGLVPLFITRDRLGGNNLVKLLQGDKDARKLLFAKRSNPYPYFYSRQFLGRFIVGAPVGILAAYGYELMKMGFVSANHWLEYSYYV